MIYETSFLVGFTSIALAIVGIGTAATLYMDKELRKIKNRKPKGLRFEIDL